MTLHPPEKLRADAYRDPFLGIQVPPLPAAATKVAFSIVFFKMPMYKTVQSPHPSSPQVLAPACFWPELWERQDAKLILGEVAPTRRIPAAPAAAQGRKGEPNPPWGPPVLAGPAQLLAFPLPSPDSWVAGVGENWCVPGKIV